MSRSEYTPTPWSAGKKNHNDEPTVVAANGALVAVVAHECLTGREGEAMKYAHLFAAAPDLLAVHKKRLAALLEHGDPFSGDDWQEVQDLRALITKADGGSNAEAVG